MNLPKLTSLCVLSAAALPLVALAQESPPKVDRFEEPVPAGATNSPSQFRFTYPVRDAPTGQTFTEQKAAALPDVPSAVSYSDLAAGLAMPDPGPAPLAPNGRMSQAAAEAAFESVVADDSTTQ